MNIYENYVKRGADIVCALLLFVVLLPVSLVISASILVTMGRPVIFRQPRPGLNEQIFTALKFRTMSIDPDKDDCDRLTRLGNFLRRLSLDEIPQLVNVLRGEMSFIGPRPLATQYLGYYTSEEKKRHSVRPGLTGLAQVSGRNNLSWEDRFRLDVSYASDITLLKDISIIFQTLAKLALPTDIVVRGTGTVGDFDVIRRAQLRVREVKHCTNEERNIEN